MNKNNSLNFKKRFMIISKKNQGFVWQILKGNDGKNIQGSAAAHSLDGWLHMDKKRLNRLKIV